jgi:hypothetical protein
MSKRDTSRLQYNRNVVVIGQYNRSGDSSHRVGHAGGIFTPQFSSSNGWCVTMRSNGAPQKTLRAAGESNLEKQQRLLSRTSADRRSPCPHCLLLLQAQCSGASLQPVTPQRRFRWPPGPIAAVAHLVSFSASPLRPRRPRPAATAPQQRRCGASTTTQARHVNKSGQPGRSFLRFPEAMTVVSCTRATDPLERVCVHSLRTGRA